MSQDEFTQDDKGAVYVSGLSSDDVGVHGTIYSSTISTELVITNEDGEHDDFTPSIPSAGTPQVVAAGGVAQYSFQIAPTGKSFSSPITFSVAGLPSGATAGFNPATIAVNAGPQAVTLSIQTAKTTGMLRGPGWTGTGTLLCVLLLPLPILIPKRRLSRTYLRLLVLALSVFAGAAATTALTGCAGSGSAAASANTSQTYNIVVTVSNGNENRTLAFPLTIQ